MTLQGGSGKRKEKKTSDRVKLTEATVVTSETVEIIWKKSETVDAANVGQLGNYQVRLFKTGSATK